MNCDLLSDDEGIIAAFGDWEKCGANLKQFLKEAGSDLSEEDAQAISRSIWEIHASAVEMKKAREFLMAPTNLPVH